MRNALAPVNKLPPELLAHVCTFRPDVASVLAHTCAQVCRHWRNTLLASPSVWNAIHVQDPLHVDVHLARSGKVPLDVYYYGWAPVDRVCRKVAPHMDRIRLLHLSLRPDGCEKILDSLSGGRGMRLLRELRFEKGSAYETSPVQLRLSASMMEKISSFAANITALSLWDVDTYLSSLAFPRLLSFSLAMQDRLKGLRNSDVVGFLRNSPMLKWFRLHPACYLHADDADTHIEPVALRHLKYAKFGGRPSPLSPDSLQYIEVDILPYLRLPQTRECVICIRPVDVTLPPGTNYLLTLIRAWELISSPGGSFGEGAMLDYAFLSIPENPSMLSCRSGLKIGTDGGLQVRVDDPEFMAKSGWSMPARDWEMADEAPGVGYAGDIQAQLSQLGRYLDPLRWSPSPLAALRILVLNGFSYTKNKGKYLEYLRECFRGCGEIHTLGVVETNLWMIAHLLRPFEDESSGMVLLFPRLETLVICGCGPVGLPLPVLLEVVKKRSALGSVLRTIWVDEEVELLGAQDKVDPSVLIRRLR